MDIDVLTVLSRLTDALGRATALDAVYEAALDALQRALAVERASILLFDDAGVMSFVAWRGLSPEYRCAVNGHTPWQPDSTDLNPILVSDWHDDLALASYRSVFEAEDIRALAFFPLVHRGRVIGKFMLYYRDRHDFTPAEVEVATTIAGQIAFGVARVRAEVALEQERGRLRDLVANVPGVVWEMEGTPGVDQRLTFLSDQVEDLLGYPAAHWYNMPPGVGRAVVSNSQAEVAAHLLATSDRSAPSIHHYQVRTADDRLIWVEVRSAQTVENGQRVIRGVTTDITARKEAEHRAAFLDKVSTVLAASLDYETTLAETARLIVSELADWCIINIVGDDGVIQRFTARHRDGSRNTPLEKIRLYAPSAHLVRDVIDAGNAVFVPRTDAAWWQQFDDQPELQTLLRELGLASLIIVPLEIGGRVFGAISIASADPARLFGDDDLAMAREVGRRAAYAVDHARLYRKAQEANRAKDEFLATLSHELRTPMTATLGWAMMLRAADLSPENYRLAVDTIERSTRAQAKLIDEILDVSRIVTGKLTLSIGPVDLRAVISAAVEAIRPTLAAKGLDLKLELASITGVPSGDAARLQQVIWNLLSNSVKFTPSGGEIRVTLDQPEAAHARILVRDNGQGIAPALLPSIFERFRQGNSSSTRAQGGLGLGLAIVQSIIDLHGGSVKAESDGDGRGATFTILLPVATVSIAVDDTPPIENTAAYRLDGVDVLLVEDEADTRQMLATALQRFGANVQAVGSADAAVDALRQNGASVLVSDIGMPGEDGCSMLMRIRRGDAEICQDIPAIALTAYARDEDRARTSAAGYAWHVAKPVDLVTVVRAVREAVRANV
jgi:PAS domain S-box-containing protein